MPKKSESDLDELLALSGDATDPKAPEEETDFDKLVDTPVEEAPSPDNTPVIEDDQAEEIAALKAALAKPSTVPVKVKSERELSPQEREIRDLKDQLARRKAEEFSYADPEFDETSGSNVISIHVLEDGFTINGELCYRGREIDFVVGSEAHKQTRDRYGKSWLDMTVEDQVERWGTEKFGFGRWPFRQLAQLTLRDLPEDSTPADLEAVQKAAARNDRRAPVNR